MVTACFLTLGKGQRAGSPFAAALALYVKRADQMMRLQQVALADEAALVKWLVKEQASTTMHLTLLDPKGSLVSSEEFAGAMGRARDEGKRKLVYAIGPADGWSAAMLRRADATVAFGRITLPHELAAVVLAEQMYRALTILAGHPYHTGH